MREMRRAVRWHSCGAMAVVVAALLALGACTALRHERGSESCYCHTDLSGGSSAAVSHEWKL
ncbi:MAG: hypothetical protein ACM30I_00890 [Gemmatimonas sp.]